MSDDGARLCPICEERDHQELESLIATRVHDPADKDQRIARLEAELAAVRSTVIRWRATVYEALGALGYGLSHGDRLAGVALMAFNALKAHYHAEEAAPDHAALMRRVHRCGECRLPFALNPDQNRLVCVNRACGRYKRTCGMNARPYPWAIAPEQEPA